MTDPTIDAGLEGLLSFLCEIDALKLVERRSYVRGGLRRENSAEHSWHVAVAAWVLTRKAGVQVDLGHLLKLAIAHDLGEIDAGDVSVYASARREPSAAEEACIERLRQLAPETLAELPALWREYEAQETLESRWIKVADRILPFLHNLACEGRGWREQGVRRAQVTAISEPVARTFPALYRWMEAQVDAAVARGWLPADGAGSEPARAPGAASTHTGQTGFATLQLRGREVTLRPLSRDDAPGLARAAAEGRDSFGYTPVPSGLEQASAYIERALSMRDAGTRCPFAVWLDGRLVGTTSFWDFVRFDWPAGAPLARAEGFDALEIGHTWLAASAQRTRCNTEAKYLMLRHAFEVFGVHRVRLRTDVRNERSRRAIERLGAKFDGVVRGDKAGSDGTVRDSAYFSLLREEWPDAEARLRARLSR